MTLTTTMTRWGYQRIAKPFFFRRDPEDVHDRICGIGKSLGRFSFIRYLLRKCYTVSDERLSQKIHGITFPNPVGLAAGFDKNAELTSIIPAVGFGFEEVGSITGEACQGNPKPRLWRLPESKGLVVYYGLKNKGCEFIARSLRGRVFDIPIGTSIAKTNSPTCVRVEEGIEDYVKAFLAFTEIGDYFTINISCPNAYGGEPFAHPERLERLLSALDVIPTKKPIFIKISADTSVAEVDDLLTAIENHRVHGLIVANLTKDYSSPYIHHHEIQPIIKGGISGKPVSPKANTLIKHIYKKTKNRYCIIGCGGIFTAQDAYEKIKDGASLLQLITGMIFEGPQVISEINRGLLDLLERDGYSHISEVIGVANRVSCIRD